MRARCPICTVELPDANAVRRHTLVEHGVATAAPPGQWAPVAGPLAEAGPSGEAGPGGAAGDGGVTGPGGVAGPAGQGWHPDPWNASALRWWDGNQWSGRTAPIGSPPPQEAPPAPRRLSGVTTRVAGTVAVVVVLVIVAVVVFSGHSKAKTVATAPTVSLAPLPTTAPAVGGGGLATGVLATSDLPGGWTVRGAPTALPARDYTAGPCNSPLWAHDVAGYRTVLADGGGSLLENAQIESAVLESASPNATSAQAAYAMSPSFVDCAKAEVTAQAQAALAAHPNAQLGGVTADPLNLSLATPNVGYVLDVSIVDPALGVGTYVADDHIELFNGPYEGSLDIITLSTNPIADTLVQTEAAAAAQRLAALPPGGTLHTGAV